jgi:hypothetical protein
MFLTPEQAKAPTSEQTPARCQIAIRQLPPSLFFHLLTHPLIFISEHTPALFSSITTIYKEAYNTLSNRQHAVRTLNQRPSRFCLGSCRDGAQPVVGLEIGQTSSTTNLPLQKEDAPRGSYLPLDGVQAFHG